MKIRRDGILLDQRNNTGTGGDTKTLNAMGEWIQLANLSETRPLTTGSYTARAEAWVDQGNPANVSANAPNHDHPFTIGPP